MAHFPIFSPLFPDKDNIFSQDISSHHVSSNLATSGDTADQSVISGASPQGQTTQFEQPSSKLGLSDLSALNNLTNDSFNLSNFFSSNVPTSGGATSSVFTGNLATGLGSTTSGTGASALGGGGLGQVGTGGVFSAGTGAANAGFTAAAPQLASLGPAGTLAGVVGVPFLGSQIVSKLFGKKSTFGGILAKHDRAAYAAWVKTLPWETQLAIIKPKPSAPEAEFKWLQGSTNMTSAQRSAFNISEFDPNSNLSPAQQLAFPQAGNSGPFSRVQQASNRGPDSFNYPNLPGRF